MEMDPHQMIEGIIISAYAIRAHTAFVYIRGEVLHVVRRMQAAVEELYANGFLGPDVLGSGYALDVVVHAGAGAYICGEETALLDSLEGYRGQPRLRPHLLVLFDPHVLSCRPGKNRAHSQTCRGRARNAHAA